MLFVCVCFGSRVQFCQQRHLSHWAWHDLPFLCDLLTTMRPYKENKIRICPAFQYFLTMIRFFFYEVQLFPANFATSKKSIPGIGSWHLPRGPAWGCWGHRPGRGGRPAARPTAPALRGCTARPGAGRPPRRPRQHQDAFVVSAQGN